MGDIRFQHLSVEERRFALRKAQAESRHPAFLLEKAESHDKEHAHDIDVRRNTGIDRNPLDAIKAIHARLADAHEDAGEGRTLFRELVWKDRPI